MNIGQNLKDRKVKFVYIIIPIAPYVIWVFATYVLEGQHISASKTRSNR